MKKSFKNQRKKSGYNLKKKLIIQKQKRNRMKIFALATSLDSLQYYYNVVITFALIWIVFSHVFDFFFYSIKWALPVKRFSYIRYFILEMLSQPKTAINNVPPTWNGKSIRRTLNKHGTHYVHVYQQYSLNPKKIVWSPAS